MCRVGCKFYLQNITYMYKNTQKYNVRLGAKSISSLWTVGKQWSVISSLSFSLFASFQQWACVTSEIREKISEVTDSLISWCERCNLLVLFSALLRISPRIPQGTLGGKGTSSGQTTPHSHILRPPGGACWFSMGFTRLIEAPRNDTSYFSEAN